MGRWKDKYVIGITGNIATGKSLVRKMLEHLGAYTIDADGLTHQVMAPSAPAYRPVIESFGKWIIGAEGRIDRGRLGAVVFAHPAALKQLESITHPIIGKAIDTLIQRAKHKVVVVEAIKLLEGQFADQVDAIWVVDAPHDVQLQRLMEKRGLTEPEARKRISIQNPQAEKLKAASVVIRNTGDVSETWAQVQAAWGKIGSGPAPDTETVARVDVSGSQSATPTKRELKEITIKRPQPSHLDAVAKLINMTRGKQLSKADLMMSFTETSYLVAMSEDELIGVISFVVENLITQSSEIALLPDIPTEPVLNALINEMESAADSLQSEVSFIYLKQEESSEIIGLLQEQLGYSVLQKITDIKFPAWREALHSRPEGTIILYKELREDKILTPF
ncbi:MAG: dephospho-CoA kinase [Chloroflexi bacterium]|nr:dephospho-CoA kinase [Chloroflexota bacterium]